MLPVIKRDSYCRISTVFRTRVYLIYKVFIVNKYTRMQRIMPQRMSNKNVVVNFSTRRVSGIKRFEETKLIIRIRKDQKEKVK